MKSILQPHSLHQIDKTTATETENGQEWTLRLDVEFFMAQPPTRNLRHDTVHWFLLYCGTQKYTEEEVRERLNSLKGDSMLLIGI